MGLADNRGRALMASTFRTVRRAHGHIPLVPVLRGRRDPRCRRSRADPRTLAVLPECVMAVTTAQLGDLLARLTETADASRTVVAADLCDRWARARLRMLLVGEAKRGKSTVGNAILGRDVLPTGVIPLTAVTTTVRTGTPERVEVHHHDGRARHRIGGRSRPVRDRDRQSRQRTGRGLCG